MVTHKYGDKIEQISEQLLYMVSEQIDCNNNIEKNDSFY